MTRDGRLISGLRQRPSRGARLRRHDAGADARRGPRRGAGARLAGSRSPPRVTEQRGARTTTFATGEAARRCAGPRRADGPRLAWDVYTDGADGALYDVLVDAESAETLAAPPGPDGAARAGAATSRATRDRTAPAAQITMPPAWYDEHAGGTRLWGQYARTYIDPQRPGPGGGRGAGRRARADPGQRRRPAAPDWLYTRSHRLPGRDAVPGQRLHVELRRRRRRGRPTSSRPATNAHVLVEPLPRAPRAGADRLRRGLGQLPAHEHERRPGSATTTSRSRSTTAAGLNNANFATPPDGTRAADADVPVHRPRRQRQRHRRHRLPRDTATG